MQYLCRYWWQSTTIWPQRINWSCAGRLAAVVKPRHQNADTSSPVAKYMQEDFRSLSRDIRVANDASEVAVLLTHHIGKFGAACPGRIEAHVPESLP